MQWLKNTLSDLRANAPGVRRKFLVFAAIAAVSVSVLLSSLDSGSTKVSANPSVSFVESQLYVAISGAVLRPGVYPVEASTRLFEVVSAAGGFTKKANRDSVNLARLVTDGEQITVFAREVAARGFRASRLVRSAARVRLAGRRRRDTSFSSTVLRWRPNPASICK